MISLKISWWPFLVIYAWTFILSIQNYNYNCRIYLFQLQLPFCNCRILHKCPLQYALFQMTLYNMPCSRWLCSLAIFSGVRRRIAYFMDTAVCDGYTAQRTRGDEHSVVRILDGGAGVVNRFRRTLSRAWPTCVGPSKTTRRPIWRIRSARRRLKSPTRRMVEPPSMVEISKLSSRLDNKFSTVYSAFGGL